MGFGLPEKLFYGTGIPACILIFPQDQGRTDKVRSSMPAASSKSGKNRTSSIKAILPKIVLKPYRAGGETVEKLRLSSPRPEELARERLTTLNIPGATSLGHLRGKRREIDLVARPAPGAF